MKLNEKICYVNKMDILKLFSEGRRGTPMFKLFFFFSIYFSVVSLIQLKNKIVKYFEFYGTLG
jgi:hypothetical protein